MSNPHFLSLIGDNQDALKGYNQQLLLQPQDYENLIGRSIIYYQLGQFEDSINDCNNAILINRKRYEGYYRRGLAQLASGKVQAALIDLEESVSRAENLSLSVINRLNAAARKCQAQLTNIKFKEAATIKYQPVQSQPIQQQPVQQQPVQQQKKMEVEEKKESEAVRTNVSSSSGKPVYKWYQTDTKIGIEISQVLESQDKLQTKMTPKSLEVSFPLANNENFELSLDLWGEIVPEHSRARVGLNQIEILLEKKTKSQSWVKLLADVEVEMESDEKKPEKQAVPAQVQGQGTSFYPSSSKVKKDWSKIDKEIEQDISKNKEEYGEDSFSFFRELYEKSDENTRKAMVKSMQTSGGTCLSNNWDEVAKKDYEGKDKPSPPKGQERKFFK